MAQYGLLLRVTHTGKAGDSVHVSDIRDGVDLLASFRKAGPVYVPVPAKGGQALLVYSGDVAVSFESGGIRKFIEGGYLTAEFIIGTILGPAVYPTVEDEGILVDPATTLFDFVGAGVTAIQTAPGQVQINVPGGGVASHPALSNLAWLIAGHTGTPNTLAAFDGAGAAALITTTVSGDVSGTLPGPLTVTDFSFPGEAWGDVLFFDGTNWSLLPAGASGQRLQTNGPGADPSWVTPSAGVTDHAALTNLGWTVSGHTGANGSIALFNGAAGAASVLTGVLQGDLVFFNGTDWDRLAPGSVGQYLRLAAGPTPTWGNIGGGDLILANIPVATYTTVQDMQDLIHSSGELSGGLLTDLGGGNVSVGAGTGLIRATNDNYDTLLFFDWAAVPLVATPTDSTRYFGIEHNGGAPQLIVKSTDTWNYQDEFPIATVFNESDVLHIHHNSWEVYDVPGRALLRMKEVGGFQRDNWNGGLIIGETGARNLTVTAGAIWYTLHRYTIGAIDTSGADTFERFYRDGFGGWTKQTLQTQWDNANYDDGSGALQPLSPNRYAVQWFYMDIDGHMLSLYGRGEYSNLADALDEAIPNTAPDRVAMGSILLGRVVFQEGAGSAIQVDSAFIDDLGTGGGVSSHPDLANLAWNVSGHTGTANTAAGFDGTGAATFLSPLLADGSVAGATGTAQDFGSNGITADNIDESTADNGVVINGIRNYGKLAADPPVGPDPAPADGDTYYNTVLRMPMAYDGLRSKWLSVESSEFHFGRDGVTAVGQYYRAADGRVMSAALGWYAIRTGTVVSLGYTRSDSDQAVFDIVQDGASIATVSSTAAAGRDVSLNADFTFGDVLAVLNQAGGGNNPTSDVIGWIRVKWRV